MLLQNIVSLLKNKKKLTTKEKKQRKKWRWMKYVVAYGLVMDTLITLVVLYVTVISMEINSAAIATVAALWSLEGLITCVLKIFEGKADTSEKAMPSISNNIEEDYMI